MKTHFAGFHLTLYPIAFSDSKLSPLTKMEQTKEDDGNDEYFEGCDK